MRYLWFLPVLFFAAFYFYPLGRIIAVSARIEMLATVLNPATWRTAGFTFWQAALSTIVTLALGLPGAYLVGRYQFRGKGLLRALTAVPFVMPTLVVAAGFNALIGERGWINLLLMRAGRPSFILTGTLTAIVLAHVFYNVTIVIRLVGDYWSRLDPRLTHAAQVLGASRLRSFAAVTLPLLLPAIAAASLLIFIFDFTSFGAVLVLGGPRLATLEVEIYRQTFAFFDLPAAAALSILQLIFTLVFTLAYGRLSAGLARHTALQPESFTQRPLRTPRQKLAAAVIAAGLLALTTLPLASLAIRSVWRLEADRGQREGVTPKLTLAYYRALFENEQGAAFFATPVASVGNSARFAAATVLLSLAFGTPTAWLLARQDESQAGGRPKMLRAMEAALMLPLGTSAVTLGLGFLLAFGGPPFNLRASPILIPIAHTLIAFPFVVRALLPTWRSIRPQWRQAAATLGAAPREVWRRIDLPLVGRAALVAAAFAFTLSLGEFGATALLSRPEFPTISTAIYSFIGKPGALNYGRALALSTLLMVTTAASILTIERLRLKGLSDF